MTPEEEKEAKATKERFDQCVAAFEAKLLAFEPNPLRVRRPTKEETVSINFGKPDLGQGPGFLIIGATIAAIGPANVLETVTAAYECFRVLSCIRDELYNAAADISKLDPVLRASAHERIAQLLTGGLLAAERATLGVAKTMTPSVPLVRMH